MISKVFSLKKKRRITKLLPFIFSFLSSAIGIILNFILARAFGSDNYGEIQYLVSLATTASSFMTFGLSWIVVRDAKNENRSSQIINSVFTIFFFLAIFEAPIVFFTLYNFTKITHDNYLFSLLVVIVAVIIGTNTLGASYFQGRGKYHISILVSNFFPKLCMLIMTIFFLVIGKIMNFQENYLIFYLIFYGISSLIILKKLFKKTEIKITKSEGLSIFFFFGVTMTYSLSGELTKIFQTTFFNNPASTGIISLSITLIAFVGIITNVITDMIKPYFAKLKRENDYEGILNTYRLNTRLTSYICIPFYIFMITQGSKFLSFFGPSYTIYPYLIIMLAFRSLVADITGPSGTMLSMIGKEKIELINGFINIGTFVLFAFIFSNDEVYGLCFALLLSTIVVNITKYIEVWVLFRKTPLDIKTLITLLVIAVIDFFAIFFLKFIGNMWIWLIVAISVGLLTIGVNFLVSLYRKDLRAFFKINV